MPVEISNADVIGFYLWLAEAAVVLIAAASSGAHKRRPGIVLLVAPLLIICPIVGHGLAASGGSTLALICGLAATWMPLIGVKLVPQRIEADASSIRPHYWWFTREHIQTAQAETGQIPSLVSVRQSDDPYRILGVTASASEQEIKAAWRRRATENHPDKVAHLGPAARKDAEEQMARINRAYQALQRRMT